MADDRTLAVRQTEMDQHPRGLRSSRTGRRNGTSPREQLVAAVHEVGVRVTRDVAKKLGRSWKALAGRGAGRRKDWSQLLAYFAVAAISIPVIVHSFR